MSPILALIPNWLGDAILCVPALAQLRRQGRVIAVGHPDLLALLRDLDVVTEVEPFDRRGADAGWLGLWRAGRRLRRHAPTLAVVFAPSLRAAALAAASGAPRRRGFGGEGRALLLNDRPPRPPRSVHLSDAWLELAHLARDLDATRADATRADAAQRAALRPGAAGRAGLAALRAELPALPPAGAFFAIAPGATYGPTKRWGEERFVEAARGMAQQRGLVAVVVGGGGRDERELCERVAERAAGISLAGRTSLPVLAALLSEAAAFLGNDSGPMHVAAALGTPTVGIFGSSSPRWSGPRGITVESVGPAPVPCSPCFRPQCPIGLPCLVNLPAASAVEAIDRLLNARQGGAGAAPHLAPPTRRVRHAGAPVEPNAP